MAVILLKPAVVVGESKEAGEDGDVTITLGRTTGGTTLGVSALGNTLGRSTWGDVAAVTGLLAKISASW